MNNFECLTNTLQAIFLDAQLGLSLPVRRMLALLTACLLEGTDAHLTDVAEAFPDVDTSQPAKKQRIRNSRVDGTRVLCEALTRLAQPPKVLVSAPHYSLLILMV